MTEVLLIVVIVSDRGLQVMGKEKETLELWSEPRTRRKSSSRSNVQEDMLKRGTSNRGKEKVIGSQDYSR